MQLTLEMLRQIAQGVERVERRRDGFHFYRMTHEQEAVYAGSDLLYKTQATAGVRLDFLTDSRQLYLRTVVAPGSSRRFFLFDIHVNGARAGTLGNISEEGSLTAQYSLGRFERAFALGEGVKHVVIYFPFSVQAVLEEMRLDDGAVLIPYRYPKRMLLFGDAITQGYDTRHPDAGYAARLADALKVEGINKGMGGDVFCGRLAAAEEPLDPAYITVAYGSDDWRKRSRADFERECTAFYTTLAERYPRAQIFAIAPLWRADADAVFDAGDFRSIAAYIARTVAPLPHVTFVDAFDFVPHDRTSFADGKRYPCDTAFAAYFACLMEAMLPHLGEKLC